jgi:hypothetical protein
MSSRTLVRRLSAVALGLLALAPVPAAAGQPRALASVYAATLERAREGAARKLERPECRSVLDEFRDRTGRSLAENLASKWNRSPAEYLRMIPFVDGASHSLCRRNVHMFVTMGTPRVFVCRSFAEQQVRSPFSAENMVIHEMLHTLGLGENPPSSEEISRRVNGRCQ